MLEGPLGVPGGEAPDWDAAVTKVSSHELLSLEATSSKTPIRAAPAAAAEVVSTVGERDRSLGAIGESPQAPLHGLTSISFCRGAGKVDHCFGRSSL